MDITPCNQQRLKNVLGCASQLMIMTILLLGLTSISAAILLSPPMTQLGAEIVCSMMVLTARLLEPLIQNIMDQVFGLGAIKRMNSVTAKIEGLTMK